MPVAGKTGIATLQMMLVNMREGGFISAYDFEVGLSVARVLCGGELERRQPRSTRTGSSSSSAREFMSLLRHEKTQARIAHTLATGKPLRN